MSDPSDPTPPPRHDDALTVEVGALHAMLETHRESKPDEAPLETDADSSKSERAADVRAKNDPEK